MSDILYCLEKEPKRFSQIMFETKLNPSILDRHLKVLLKFGLVVKDGNFYRLTESGIRVVETIDELLEVFRKNLD
nr:ArsR family transcriptional regulator [Archaeoglobus neptunius]